MDYPSLAALLPSSSTLGGFVSWADLLLSSNPIRKGLIDNNPFYRWTCSIRKSSQQKTLLQLDELLHLKSLFTHSPNTKYSITPTNTSHILLKYSPCHWAPTNILYTQAHKLSWALSQILSIIAHILTNLGFHKICSSYYYQNWAVNYTIPTQSPISFGLWEKLKESPNSKSPTMMWLIPKSHYDVANSKVSLQCG